MKIAEFFLDEATPFRKYRPLKKKTVFAILGISIVIFLLVIVLIPTPSKEDRFDLQSKNMARTQQAPLQNSSSSPYFENHGYGGTRSSLSSRSYSASQLVIPAGASRDKLPTATTISAQLLNTVISTDANNPVIALVPSEVRFNDVAIIPAGSKMIGQGTYDDIAKRLQVRFHSVVFPDGKQSSVAAIALQGDGSSGLPGIYHSERMKAQTGRILGNFAGGVASGLKDKNAGGFGTTYEPGSIKNGILNGIAETALDQAKVFTDDMQNIHPYLEVKAGTQFLIYFEREFNE